ncbi:MAG: DUF1848 domain-containing protein [Clostridia bacterium]|jgi:hypothetical protein|nr:DUF1848 domain-containing protein [Clostridia bacterium]
MIINTGQRTDIPAFYSEWFVNRLKAGFVLARNPYNPQRITRYRLTPDVVDVIGFCTKNPAPMLPHMDLLRPFGQYWYVTITPYGRDIEPHVPNKLRVLESFRRLSQIAGVNSVGWRYDPILISEEWPVQRHIKAFEYMANALRGYTKTAVISFIDLYEKTKRNFPEAKTVSPADQMILGKAMAEICDRCGMTLRPCAEGNALAPFGADCSGCMTAAMYEQAIGQRLKIPSRAPARKACACYLGGDIGAYNSCGHLCRYCYANYDAETVRANLKAHDPQSPLLIGHVMPGDEIRDADQESWKDYQIALEI